MALIFLKKVTLTGRATRAPPEDRSSAHVGYLDCQKLYGGDLNLSPEFTGFVELELGAEFEFGASREVTSLLESLLGSFLQIGNGFAPKAGLGVCEHARAINKQIARRPRSRLGARTSICARKGGLWRLP